MPLCSSADIPEEEAKYWTKKLKQMNSLEEEEEVGLLLSSLKVVLRWGPFLAAARPDPELGSQTPVRGLPALSLRWHSGQSAALQDKRHSYSLEFDPDRLHVDSAFHPSRDGQMRAQVVGGNRLAL